MLESGLNQGVGLQRIAPRTPLRLVALASHGDKASELPLLWSLCSTWIGLGYPVVVLDMTARESADNPGLQQLLDGTCWDESANSGTTWSVFPAADGLRQLQKQAAQPRICLDFLSELFSQYEIILVYAGTDVIVSLFQDSGVAPLLAMSARKQALLTTYLSAKELLLNARLQPTIVSVVDEVSLHAPAAQDLMSKNLQNCAMNFLGQKITTLTAHANPVRTRSLDDMKRLALRLLESAALLERGAPMAPAHMQGRIPEGH